jgi:glutaredoxin
VSYSEKLKDPRWQRKRLETLNTAGWKCTSCGRTKRTLHVHHLRYVPGRDPWDYADSDLEVICELCHQERHGLRKSDPDLEVIFSEMDGARRKQDWNELQRLKELSDLLIEHGAFWKPME